MIVTDLRSIDHQASMTPVIKKAIEFLRRPDILNMADGRVEIEGGQVFANIQRYETVIADVPKIEYHKKYVDIQYVASGEEVIGWAPADEVTVTEAYDADKDICFGTILKDKLTLVYMHAGQVAVFYPEDGHAPRLAAGAPSHVLKIVVKVAVVSEVAQKQPSFVPHP
ncbi:MAG: YhcH/YjgK/YiaL family protein [Nitrospirae bacterium]|nr:YhcH/YjgK/YiaL family protein [Nitrospirota bacterium]